MAPTLLHMRRDTAFVAMGTDANDKNSGKEGGRERKEHLVFSLQREKKQCVDKEFRFPGRWRETAGRGDCVLCDSLL